MSFHELLLNQRYYGINVWSVAGLFITLGIMTSCICRINARRPRKWWRITLESLLYVLFGAWAMESFMDLLFLQMFSGYDIAIGCVVMLHLCTTYAQWEGEDCVCDWLNFWRKRRQPTFIRIWRQPRHR